MDSNSETGRALLELAEVVDIYAEEHIDDVAQSMTDWIDEHAADNSDLQEALSEIQNQYVLSHQSLPAAVQQASVVMDSAALGLNFALSFVDKIPKGSEGGAARKRSSKVRKSKAVKALRKTKKGKGKRGGAATVTGGGFMDKLSAMGSVVAHPKRAFDSLTPRQQTNLKLLALGGLATATIAVAVACPYIIAAVGASAAIVAGTTAVGNALGVGIAVGWPYVLASGPLALGIALLYKRMPRLDRDKKELERLRAKTAELEKQIMAQDKKKLEKQALEGTREVPMTLLYDNDATETTDDVDASANGIKLPPIRQRPGGPDAGQWQLGGAQITVVQKPVSRRPVTRPRAVQKAMAKTVPHIPAPLGSTKPRQILHSATKKKEDKVQKKANQSTKRAKSTT